LTRCRWITLLISNDEPWRGVFWLRICTLIKNTLTHVRIKGIIHTVL
jgi:hypothetical protein